MQRRVWIIAGAFVLYFFPYTAAPSDQHAPGGSHYPATHSEKNGGPKLRPAEGASVTILSPTAGETFTGDKIPIRYAVVKGKKEAHLHAYVDGEVMGMFSHPESGTLTGIQPGTRTLELRVVVEDHATDSMRRTECGSP